MSSARTMLDRVREERRVRRDFDRLLLDNGLEGLDREPQARPGRPRGRPRRLRWAARTTIAIFAALVLVVSIAVLQPFGHEFTDPFQTAFVYAQDGTPIATIRPPEDRVVVPLERIPPYVRDAVIAAEDERFYQHPGVDPVAIARAAWANVTGEGFQGASTITQQLVKNVLGPGERTLWRKIQEAVLALRLEREASKDEILERYLNQIYLGEGTFGLEAAARHYFDRHAWTLSLAQAALLAGMIAAPSAYDPRAAPDEALARRDWVLGRMVGLGMVSEERANRAEAAPLRVARPEPHTSRAAHFVDFVRRYIARKHGEEELFRGGLRIETTLDLGMQDAAERAIAPVLDQPGDPEAALVAIDVETGGILSMVGGRDFNRSQVNLATGQGGTGRQSGSAFKPFVLATALDEGISPYRVYPAPSTISLPGWTVSNYGGGSYGSKTVASATADSVNTVFAQLIMDVGPEDVVDTAHAMGIRSPLEAVGSLTLGTSEVTPLEMAAGFATLASSGVYHPPTPIRRIERSDGEILERLDPKGRRALPEDVARQTTTILKSAVAGGTGSAAALPGIAVAGKTGTAEDHADAWFCGYTAEIAACVWVGYRNARVPMTSVHGIPVTGGTFPAQIWRAFMLEAVSEDDHGAASGTLFGDSGSGTSGDFGAAPSGDPAGTDEGQEPAPPEAPPADEPPAEEPPPEDEPPPDDGLIPDIIPPPG